MKATARQQRAISAYDLLQISTRTLPDVQDFLEADQTPLIATICLTDDHRDPRTVCLGTSSSRQLTPDLLFRRLLAMRFLALEYKGWQRQRDKSETEPEERRPDNYGECKIFIRESRLPDTSQTRGWFEQGLKLLRLERRTGIVGVSLAMMFAFPRFAHFYNREVENAIRLLNQGYYPAVMEVAKCISEDFIAYSNFYREHMGLFHSFSLKDPTTNFAQILYPTRKVDSRSQISCGLIISS